MRWLIDSDVLIEGERGHPAFLPWLAAASEVATADIIRGEFLLGVHAVSDVAKRARGEQFYAAHMAGLASLGSEPQDYETAARLAPKLTHSRLSPSSSASSPVRPARRPRSWPVGLSH